MTPSLNQFASQIAVDGSRNDLAVLLGLNGSRLGAVCLGRIGDRGSPMESTEHTIDHWEKRKIGRCIETPSVTEMAGCEAVTYVMARDNGETLRDWKFAREGWLFVAGILRNREDRPSVESLGLRSLETWEWIPGTEATVVPQSTAETVTEVTEISESILTTAPAATVWALIRPVENNAFLHKNLVDAFRVPGTPEGVGEEQSIVLQFPGYRRTVTSILLEEVPMARIVTRTHGANDPVDQQVYTLEAEGERTRLTVSMKYSVGLDTHARERRAQLTRQAIHEYLARVEEVLGSGWTERSNH